MRLVNSETNHLAIVFCSTKESEIATKEVLFRPNGDKYTNNYFLKNSRIMVVTQQRAEQTKIGKIQFQGETSECINEMSSFRSESKQGVIAQTESLNPSNPTFGYLTVYKLSCLNTGLFVDIEESVVSLRYF